MTETRVEAGRLEDLGADEVRVVRLAPSADGRPREALVLRDEHGTPRAYLNRCKHLPIPIDGGSREFLAPDGSLRCGTHGALYRRSDGLCTVGPCAGQSLEAIPIECDAGQLYLPDT